MDEITALADLVERLYSAQAVSLHPLNSESGKRIFRVGHASGQRWVLRTYSSLENRNDIFDLVTMLLFLESQGYPAERIVRTVNNEVVATADDYWVLMTTFIEGRTADYSLPTLHLMGSMLGQLHALNPPQESTFGVLRNTGVPTLPYTTPAPMERLTCKDVQPGLAIPVAEMLPARELAYAMGRLTSVANQVPKSLQARYDMLVAAVQNIDRCEDLPSVIIHNDYHPGNIIQTQEGQLIPIDWEGAGLGPAVIDVGFLLSSCISESPWTPQLPPDDRRIIAIVDGYCQHHRLSSKELDLLADAIRFRALVYGAVSFADEISEGRSGEMPQWWMARYNAAEEIADRALSVLSSGSRKDIAPAAPEKKVYTPNPKASRANMLKNKE
jgi:Ser/Thr protein kinase RdoA (MazF antagonist)